MNLYLLRHGKAEDRRPGLSEVDRHLTPEGVEEMRREAAGLAALQFRVDSIFSSPLPRALETAQIVAKAIGFPETDIAVDSRIAGPFRIGDLQSLLAGQSPASHVLLAGHEPTFSLMVHTLCGAVIDLKKGGMAYVETDRLEPGQGVLRWLLTPRLLMRAS